MNYGLEVEHFRIHVVRSALERIDLWSPAAENLVLGTAMKESHLRYLQQLGRGPAIGLFQMEEGTYDSLWTHSLPGLKKLMAKVLQVSSFHGYAADRPPFHEMSSNLAFAAAMCRVRYYIVPTALPRQNDPYAMATYWKDHYNTALGKGTVEEAVVHFRRACKHLEVP